MKRQPEDSRKLVWATEVLGDHDIRVTVALLPRQSHELPAPAMERRVSAPEVARAVRAYGQAMAALARPRPGDGPQEDARAGADVEAAFEHVLDLVWATKQKAH